MVGSLPIRYSHTHHRDIPRRGEQAPRVDPPAVAKRKMRDFDKGLRELKQAQRQHYYQTGEWKQMPWQNPPSSTTARPAAPTPRPLIPLTDRPSFIRVDHRHPLPFLRPTLPNGIAIDEAVAYKEKQFALLQAANEAKAAADDGNEAVVDGSSQTDAEVVAANESAAPFGSRRRKTDGSNDSVSESNNEMNDVSIGDVVPSEWQKPGDQFAIVALQNRQFKVMVHDLVMAGYMADAEVGSEILLDRVLLVGARDHTMIGMPVVEGAFVKAVVEEHTKTKRVLVLKKKRRHGFRRMIGHRDKVTILRITHVESPATAPSISVMDTNKDLVAASATA